MVDSSSDDSHVRDALGLYILGALENDERARVEQHLIHCVECCVEADDLGVAVEPLVMVTPQQLRDLMAEFRGASEELES